MSSNSRKLHLISYIANSNGIITNKVDTLLELRSLGKKGWDLSISVRSEYLCIIVYLPKKLHDQMHNIMVG